MQPFLAQRSIFYDDPTVIWHAGGNVHSCPPFAAITRVASPPDLEKKWEEVRDIHYACGCALFVTQEAIKKWVSWLPNFF